MNIDNSDNDLTLVNVPATMESVTQFTVNINSDHLKYNEDQIIADVCKYIEGTYDQHYSRDNFQSTEFIIDSGHGEGFCIGNILKYAQRYGKKDGKNVKDLYKIIHYAIMAIYDQQLMERRDDREEAEELGNYVVGSDS